MSRRKRHKGPGLIWIYPPPKPLSRRGERRATEFILILELGAWISDSWADRVKREGDWRDGPITMLLAATGWLCLLALPDDWPGLIHGPPVLSRVTGPAEAARRSA